MITDSQTAGKSPEQLDLSADGTNTRLKWGGALDAGFQIVPNTLIRAQQHLGLDALDVVILLNITMHWWEVDDLPYPRPSVIANRTGVSARTVERRLAKLQQIQLLERLPTEIRDDGPSIRRFNLSGLSRRLEQLAAHEIADREIRKQRSSAKRMEDVI